MKPTFNKPFSNIIYLRLCCLTLSLNTLDWFLGLYLPTLLLFTRTRYFERLCLYRVTHKALDLRDYWTEITVYFLVFIIPFKCKHVTFFDKSFHKLLKRIYSRWKTWLKSHSFWVTLYVNIWRTRSLFCTILLLICRVNWVDPRFINILTDFGNKLWCVFDLVSVLFFLKQTELIFWI